MPEAIMPTRAQPPRHQAEAGAQAHGQRGIVQQAQRPQDHAAGLRVGDAEVDPLEVTGAEAQAAAQRGRIALPSRHLVHDVADEQRLGVGAVRAHLSRWNSL
ncbi:hypothetical protein FSC37_17005 [Piscinibacter aquaticus]|uniref:Uncharacterized protein n=1 Tax=Piscinibacter aquaticus TaxID=392597 RepID=A0A5C6U558_9BURK|nr:hypothetical protein FSC37_17005 [Piscinibacter aquaticus]